MGQRSLPNYFEAEHRFNYFSSSRSLQNYCSPKENETVERDRFSLESNSKWKILTYVTVLRTLAATCNLEDLTDSVIRSRIICDTWDHSLQDRLLWEADLGTLQRYLVMGRAAED